MTSSIAGSRIADCKSSHALLLKHSNLLLRCLYRMLLLDCWANACLLCSRFLLSFLLLQLDKRRLLSQLVFFLM